MNYKNFLVNQVKAGRLGHAYMIVGKYFDRQKLAESLVEIMGCTKADVLRVEDEKGISIDAIKMLKRELSFPPFNSERKIAIIAPADALKVEAQNALLKILEEPAKKVVIYLIVKDEDKILPTIASRCQRLTLQESRVVLTEFPEGLIEGKWSVSERFRLAEKLSKDDDLGETLDGWMATLNVLLREDCRQRKILDLIKEVDCAKMYLRTNSNSRLVMENLLLKF